MAEDTHRLTPVTHQRPPFWRDIRVLQMAGQFIFALIILFVIWQLVNNLMGALHTLGQELDFRFWLPDSFFQQNAGLSFSEGPGLTSSETFGRAFAVGIINTLRAVVVGIILATLLGIVIGVARISRNWLVRNIAMVYVELFQNTPLLLQLIFIYRGVFLTLPEIQDAVSFPTPGFHDAILRLALIISGTVIGVGALWYLRSLLRQRQGHGDAPDPAIRTRIILSVVVIALTGGLLFSLPENSFFLSRRGFVVPAFLATESINSWLLVIGVGLLAAVLIGRRRREYERVSGQPGNAIQYSIGVLVLVILAGWVLIGSVPLILNTPAPQIAQLSDGREVIRRINGGETISPEYAALTAGLILYTAAFIGEIVRAGIQAVPYGQIEAAQAVGLNRTQTLQLVILPQALRIIIPPLGNQYLNLTKNSSLATAIAFLDAFAIAKTIIHQAGRGVVTIIAVMMVYLTASLLISAGMNWLNGRMRLKER